MQPIEEGCLAIVYKSYIPTNIGKVVRVGRFLGAVEYFQEEDMWEVSEPQETAWGYVCYHQRESHLMRIDGKDFKEDIIEKDEEMNYED